MALAKEVFKYVAIAGILAYLILKIIRPLLQTMMKPAPAHSTRKTLGGNVDIIDEESEPSVTVAFDHKLGEVRNMAQQDPKAVANIIKNWTNANAS